MAQHVAPPCAEGAGLWLPLTEYAVKTGISLSTIRRKIKTNTITYRLDRGRYLILVDAKNAANMLQGEMEEPAPVPAKKEKAPMNEDLNLPLFDRALKLVSHAFEQTLKEKDERIHLLEKRSRELEDRLSELKTLVRVLEEKFEVRY